MQALHAANAFIVVVVQHAYAPTLQLLALLQMPHVQPLSSDLSGKHNEATPAGRGSNSQ